MPNGQSVVLCPRILGATEPHTGHLEFSRTVRALAVQREARLILKHVSICVLLALVLVLGAAAQTSTTDGTITGNVTDSSGASIPGAKVTATGTNMMGTPTTITDQNGFYRLPALSPGDYKVTYEGNGFGTVTREGIHISLGFTATVNVEMKVGEAVQQVNVTAEAPVIDTQAENVSNSFDAHQLASLPGSRDVWTVIAQMPAIAMGRMDVGGSTALTQQAYTAYGLTLGNRGEIEGIMTNEGVGNGGTDFFYLDYASMAEVSVSAVGNGAQMPMGGILTQFVAKSGGDQYHGDVYFDYETAALESTNVDSKQIASGLAASPSLSVYDLNRLSKFQDFSADVGGYIIKNKLWWYGAYRYTVTDQRYPTLLDATQHTWAPVYTGKINYNISDKHRLSGYYTHVTKSQPDYLGSVIITPTSRTSPALQTEPAMWNSVMSIIVFKAEYDWIISPSLVMEVRAGEYASNWARYGKSDGPRIEDIGNNFVSGGVNGAVNDRHRPQLNGSLNYSKSGWWGTHSFKFGGEVMRDILAQPFVAFPNACDCVSVLNNGAPINVYLYQGTNTTKEGDQTLGLYVNDTWQVKPRLTVNLGIRVDRNRSFLPAQSGPGGQNFAAVSNLITLNNWGPRVGVSYDVTGKGKTVVKASFGQFFNYPAADYAKTPNPNPNGWYTEYKWTDTNGNGVWNPGEQVGNPIASVGGIASTILAPNLKNSYILQSTAYLEHEIAPNFAVRTGFVWNGQRQVSGSVNLNRPLSAYNVPITVRDPGPDGKIGTADDGGTFALQNLSPLYSSLPVLNETTNLPGTNSNFYTWEVTATKRAAGGRWSLLTSFAKTWNYQAALTNGSAFTPNALINTVGEQNVFTNWQAKVNSTLNLKWGVHLTPIMRLQSGTPFARTFVASTNYGNATILSELYGKERTANLALFDVRAEKEFQIRDRFRLTGFFDVYNIFNNNGDQAIATSSGSSFLRPSAITPPRIARLGVKFQF